MARRVVLTAGVVAFAATIASTAIAQGTPAAQPALVGDADAGAEIYGTECRGCHAVSIAPTLRGLVGRPIASVADFVGYSDGLKARASEAWTEVNVDLFLTSPSTFAPGTLMVKTIADPQQRADIIAYISSLPPPRK